MNEYHVINDEQFQRKLRKLINECIEKYNEQDDIFVDPATGLEWQVNHSQDEMTWEQAIEHCANLDYAGHTDWRLPTDIELYSIIDRTEHNPACIIPETMSSSYWSPTPYIDNTDYAWRVDFYGGGVNYDHKSNEYYVRAVRTGKLK